MLSQGMPSEKNYEQRILWLVFFTNNTLYIKCTFSLISSSLYLRFISHSFSLSLCVCVCVCVLYHIAMDVIYLLPLIRYNNGFLTWAFILCTFIFIGHQLVCKCGLIICLYKAYKVIISCVLINVDPFMTKASLIKGWEINIQRYYVISAVI